LLAQPQILYKVMQRSMIIYNIFYFFCIDLDSTGTSVVYMLRFSSVFYDFIFLIEHHRWNKNEM